MDAMPTLRRSVMKGRYDLGGVPVHEASVHEHAGLVHVGAGVGVGGRAPRSPCGNVPPPASDDGGDGRLEDAQLGWLDPAMEA